jgi:hypothetical protein
LARLHISAKSTCRVSKTHDWGELWLLPHWKQPLVSTLQKETVLGAVKEEVEGVGSSAL